MQHFDGKIEKVIRAGISIVNRYGYATNAGSLRLELADFAPPPEALAASTT